MREDSPQCVFIIRGVFKKTGKGFTYLTWSHNYLLLVALVTVVDNPLAQSHILQVEVFK